MKTYAVSAGGRVRAGVTLLILVLVFLYSSRKAVGLWGGASAKPSDPQLLGLNLNTTVPAFLLTLVALGCLGVAWYLVVELLSRVRLDEAGIALEAPGYRLFYAWNKITSIDVLVEPEEDAAACLQVEVAGARLPLAQADLSADDPTDTDEIAVYLSEADLRENRARRRRQLQARRDLAASLQSRATRPDGRPLPLWMRLLYPQTRRPDRLLLYPTLEDRPALIAEIERHLARV